MNIVKKYFSTINKTALYDYHKEVLKGKMVPFCRYYLPI